MVKALVIYLLRNYSRSYRYVPIVLAYFAFVGIFYVYDSNPVMSSFAVTASVLFFVSAWLCYSFIHTENEVQEQLSILHLGSPALYYGWMLASVQVVAFLFIVFAIGYPILFQKFDEPVGIAELVVGLFTHLGVSCLGATIAACFNRKLVRQVTLAIGGIVLIAVLSFSQGALKSQLPLSLDWAVWLLPPAFYAMELLMNYDGSSAWEIAWLTLVPFLYSIGLGAVYIRLIRNKYDL